MASRFDDLSVALAKGVSRRQLLRLLAAGAGAAGVTAAGMKPVSAADAAECFQRCRRSYPVGPERTACLQACAECRGDISSVCFGGTGALCCQEGTTCCASFGGQLCCPTGSSCCTGRGGNVTCCPPNTECCGGGCCAPGQCCFSSIAPSVTCCPTGTTCCFDPTLYGGSGDYRCGTVDPATGNCAVV